MLKLLKKLLVYLKMKMLPDDGPTRESLFNIAVTGAVLTSLLNVIFVFSFKYSVTALIINPLVFVLVLVIYIISDQTKTYNIGSIILVALVNFAIFPYAFFAFGAVNGGMTSYFILGIVFTVLLVDGIAMYLLMPIEIIFYGVIYYFALKYPERIVPLESEAVVYRTSYIYMAIASLLTGIVVKILLTEYRKEGVRVKSLLSQVQDLSVKDPLTNVYNRRYMLNFLEEKIQMARKEDAPLCVIMFDIDHFKRINDTYGHVAGDEVLQEMCGIFLESCRKDDIVARYGGEEFLIIMPQTEFEIAAKRAEEIRILVSKNVRVNGVSEPITISGGVVQFVSSYDIIELIKKVDEKLYLAKTNGRNQIVK